MHKLNKPIKTTGLVVAAPLVFPATFAAGKEWRSVGKERKVERSYKKPIRKPEKIDQAQTGTRPEDP
jgi:hypothetical protein